MIAIAMSLVKIAVLSQVRNRIHFHCEPTSSSCRGVWADRRPSSQLTGGPWGVVPEMLTQLLQAVQVHEAREARILLVCQCIDVAGNLRMTSASPGRELRACHSDELGRGN